VNSTLSKARERERVRNAACDAPTRAVQEPLHLQLYSFLDDRERVVRARQLLAAIGECATQHVGGEAPSPPVGTGTPPSAVVMLLAAGSVHACCNALMRLHTCWPGVPAIALSHDVDEAGLAQLLAHGAFDFVNLSGADSEINLRLKRALGLLPCVAAPRAEPGSAEPLLAILQAHLIGNSPEFVKLLRRVPAMAASEASMLLLGETGTGKEACAQAIHYMSPRARGPWVAINCAAIPAELVEDELFGHVRGAYTHALEARHGLVHEAEGGTLFLDEIDSMPLAAQCKLLRFLQDKQYRVVGSSTLHTADVRVVAASNRDLRQAATSGLFRADLFYRLNVLSLALPPLRERRDDIPALTMHFMAAANREAGRRVSGITPGALQRLLDHPWPGNVRELKHALQRAVLLAQGQNLQAGDIELDDAPPPANDPMSFREAKARAVEAFERQYLEQMLALSEGNISRAAKAAQKNRRAFFELLRRHAIDAANYRGR